ncbi:MAG TPA: carboxypeptidase-like regulatory domain-containing protein, partial [Flavisolibacter sp.]|nr:carboxypeptidase-like regulatory domain-containing protein [Flavisolibacter sp.]
MDKLTGNKIPYATIGLVKENTGVNADAQGAFSIRSSWSGVDSFRISSVGYETTVLPVHGWTDGQVIRLLPKEGMLKEVIVSANRQKKVYDLNRFGHCSWNWYQIGRETIYQLAQRFEAPGDGMQLLQLELCKDRSESIFRFRIYDVDSVSKGPGKDLADTIIEVSSGETHAEINLEQHHIIIPGKSFFVAVEWIFIPYNEEYQTIKSNGVKR